MSFQNVQKVYLIPSASFDYNVQQEGEERKVVVVAVGAVDVVVALDEVLLLLLLHAAFSYTPA